jgi:hypothetical protein
LLIFEGVIEFLRENGVFKGLYSPEKATIIDILNEKEFWSKKMN